MKDFDRYRKMVDNTPAISKENFLNIINALERQMLGIAPVFKAPQQLQRYDVISCDIGNDVMHPCIVYRIDEKYVYVLMLSSSEGTHNITSLKNSRILEGSFMTNTVIRLGKEEAKMKFLAIYDNRKEADRAFALVKQFYKNLFKL